MNACLTQRECNFNAKRQSTCTSGIGRAAQSLASDHRAVGFVNCQQLPGLEKGTGTRLPGLELIGLPLFFLIEIHPWANENHVE